MSGQGQYSTITRPVLANEIVTRNCRSFCSESQFGLLQTDYFDAVGSEVRREFLGLPSDAIAIPLHERFWGRRRIWPRVWVYAAAKEEEEEDEFSVEDI